MKPANQLNERDCLRACLASLLDQRADAVPDFLAVDDPEKLENGHPRFWLAVQGWLKDLGLFMLEMRVSGTFTSPEDGEELPVLNPLQPIPFEGYCILAGYTPNGTRHMIIGRHTGNAFYKVHDPHPQQVGIVGVEAACFLIPLDPAKYMRLGQHMATIERLTSGECNQATWSAVMANAREALGKSVILSTGNVIDFKNGARIVR